MEDSIQTPLLHQSLNPPAEYRGIDGIPAKLTIIDDCYVVDVPNMHHRLLSECCDDDDDLTDESVLDDDDDDDYLNRFFGEQSITPAISLTHPDRSRLYNLPPRPRNANEMCLWTGVQMVTCIVLLDILWLIVCFNMVFGVKEIGTLRIGKGCSLLLKPNRFFVKTIIAEQLSDNVGPMLYGFNDQPSLDVVSNWSDARNASLQPNVHKEWVYFLNEGSQINVSYNIPSSLRLFLTINQGSDGYGTPWLYDDSYPDTTLSWNIIRGNGVIQQTILQSGRYHIVVGNLNSEVMEVQLNISVRGFIYDTNDAYYKCTLSQGPCVIPLLFLEENQAVLTTPQLKQGTHDGEWYVKLTYGYRWSTFFGGIVVINGAILVASVHFWVQYGHHMVRSSRAPFLSSGLL